MVLSAFLACQSVREQELEWLQPRSYEDFVVFERTRPTSKDQINAVRARTEQSYNQDTTLKWTSSGFFALQPPAKLAPLINSDNENSWDSSATTNDPRFNERLHEPLDPFIRLAGDTSSSERSLLHYYLLAAPAKFYGMRSSAIYCPVRDMTVHMVQTNDVLLQWILLSAEVFALGPTHVGMSVSFLGRRNRTYRFMNQLISDPKTRFSDYTITGLTMAALIESRLGNDKSARLHMAVVRDLVRDRSVSHKAPMQVNYATFCNCARIGLGSYAFQDEREFDSALENFLNAMIGMRQRTLDQFHPDSSHLDDRNLRARILANRYVRTHLRVFDSSRLLHRFIGPVCLETEDFKKRAHTSILWGINRTLYELRNDLGQCVEYLETLHSYMESAYKPPPTDLWESITDLDPPELKEIAVNAILGKVSTLCLSEYSEDMIDGSGSFWWQTVDSIELLQLLSPATREKILKQLSGWLLGPEESGIVDFMSEHELRGATDEIREARTAQKMADDPNYYCDPANMLQLIRRPPIKAAGKRPVTFINHDATNLQVSSQNISSINSHINLYKLQRARK